MQKQCQKLNLKEELEVWNSDILIVRIAGKLENILHHKADIISILIER